MAPIQNIEEGFQSDLQKTREYRTNERSKGQREEVSNLATPRKMLCCIIIIRKRKRYNMLFKYDQME